MGFRDRFKRSQHQPNVQDKSLKGFKVSLGLEPSISYGTHYHSSTQSVPTLNQQRRPSRSPGPPLPSRPSQDPALVPPPLPPRSTSQQSAPAILQHEGSDSTALVLSSHRETEDFVSSVLRVIYGLVFGRKKGSLNAQKQSNSNKPLYWISGLVGFGLFLLLVRHTFVSFSTAFGLAAVTAGITMICMHGISAKLQVRLLEIESTVTVRRIEVEAEAQMHEVKTSAQKEVMVEMVRRGQFGSAGFGSSSAISGFLSSSESSGRLLEL